MTDVSSRTGLVEQSSPPTISRVLGVYLLPANTHPLFEDPNNCANFIDAILDRGKSRESD